MKKSYTSVLLPIKKEYVDKIISGEKGIEFRKSKFKESIERVFIYESGTKKKNKIVGMFEIEKIVSDTPENLYDEYRDIAGISKEKYLEYFKNKDIAYGYIIKNFKQCFLNPNNCFNNFKAPQNYMYLDNSFHFLEVWAYDQWLVLERIKKAENEFPNIKEWFMNIVEKEKGLYFLTDIDAKISTLNYYFIINSEKNKISRIENIDHFYTTDSIIKEAIIQLDHKKPIRISVPENKKRFRNRLEFLGFELKTITKDKYKTGIDVYEYELNCKTEIPNKDTISFLYDEAEKYGMNPEHEFVQDLASLIREKDPKNIEIVYYVDNWGIKDINTNEVFIDEEDLKELATK